MAARLRAVRPAVMTSPRRAVLAALAGAPALARPSMAADRSWANVRASEQLIMGLEVEETGLCFRDGRGQLDGYLVAVGQGLAQGLALRPVFVEVAPGTRLAALRASRCDVLLAAPPLGPETMRLAMFSTPYAILEWRVLMAPALAREGIVGVRNLRLSAPAGHSLAWLRRQLPGTGARLIPTENWRAAAAAYRAGETDGAILTDLMASRFLETVNEIVAGPSLGDSLLGAGVRWGEHDLLQAIEMQLRLMRQRGILDILARHYKGRTAPQDVWG